MNKEECIQILMRNPKYASPWVDTAATMITEFPDQINEEYCAQYNNDQLKAIYDMLKYNATATEHHIDLDKYATPDFNDTQMHLFLTAFQQVNGDFEDLLEKIAKPEYSYEKLNYVVAALIDGLDLTDHIDYFDGKQLAILYYGFKDGVDISKYDKAYIQGDTMNVMRSAMVLGYTDVSYDVKTDTITARKITAE